MRFTIAIFVLALTTLAQDAPLPSANPARISPGIAKTLQIRQVQPIYPEIAKAAGVEGVVQLMVVIGKDGLVQSAQVLAGPALLSEAALKAVSQWAYKPFLLNGEPMAVTTEVNVTFSLRP
jgi:TonB family protein